MTFTQAEFEKLALQDRENEKFVLDALGKVAVRVKGAGGDGIPSPRDASGGILPTVVVGVPDRWIISVAGTLPGLGAVTEGDYIIRDGAAWTVIHLPVPPAPTGANLGSVLDILNTPPVGPTDGDDYLVGTVPTGVRVGHGNQIATWDAGAGVWTYVTPLNGDYVWVMDEATFYGYSGTRNTGTRNIQNIVTYARMLTQGPYPIKGFYRRVVSNAGVINTSYRGTVGSLEAEFGNTGAGLIMNVYLAQVQNTGSLTNFRPGFSGFIKASPLALGATNIYSADGTLLCSLMPGEKIYIQATITTGLTSASWDRRFVNNALIIDAGVIANIINPANWIAGAYVGSLTGLIRDNYYYDATYHYQYDGTTLYRIGIGLPSDDIIDILYADLATAIGAGTLIEGIYYRITDYQTIHLIPNTNSQSEFIGMVAGMTSDVTITADNVGNLGAITLVADSVSDIDTLIAARNVANPGNTCTLGTGNGLQVPTADITLINNINTGAVEPLIVLATSTSTISNHAWSESYPQDIIEYNYADALCGDGATARPGYITYRKDTTLDNEFFFDFRKYMNRRRRLTTGLYDTYSGTPGGAANPVLIMADDTGDHSKMADLNRQPINITGDGASDVTTLVATWNTNHPDQIVLHCSAGDLDLTDAMNIMNYGYMGLAISDARVLPNGKTVILTTSAQTPGTVYNGVYMGTGTFDTLIRTGRHFNQLTVHAGGAEIPNFGEVMSITNGFKYERDILSTYAFGDIVRDTSDYTYFCDRAILSTETGTEPFGDVYHRARINRLNLSEFVFPYGAKVYNAALTLAGGTLAGTDYTDCLTLQGGTTYYDIHTGYGSNDNVFFGNCTSIKVGVNSNKNSISGSLHTLGDNCDWNMFSLQTASIDIDSYSSGNIFGVQDAYIKLGKQSSNNVFGTMCFWDTLATSCSGNVFAGGANLNQGCKLNTMKDLCSNNTLRYSCQYNSFDENNSYHVLDVGCNTGKFGPGDSTLVFDPGATQNEFKMGILMTNMSSVNHWTSLTPAQIPDAGTFTLTYDDGVNPALTTGPIAFNALCDDIDAALETAGLLDATVTNGIKASGDFTTAGGPSFEFVGTLAPYAFGPLVQTGFLTIDTTNLTYMGAPIVVGVADLVVGQAPATHIYLSYDCEIYTRSGDGLNRLRYMDDTDNMNVVLPTD